MCFTKVFICRLVRDSQRKFIHNCGLYSAKTVFMLNIKLNTKYNYSFLHETYLVNLFHMLDNFALKQTV